MLKTYDLDKVAKGGLLNFDEFASELFDICFERPRTNYLFIEKIFTMANDSGVRSKDGAEVSLDRGASSWSLIGVRRSIALAHPPTQQLVTNLPVLGR